MNTGTVIALIKSMTPDADPEVIEQAVTDWLDDHPEATTTVEDGSITKAKLNSDVQGKIYPTLLTSSDNLDNVVTPGLYAFMSGTAPTNTPVEQGKTSALYGFLTVYKHDSYNVVYQTFMDYYGVVFTRRRNTGTTWTGWLQHASAVPTLLTSSDDINAIRATGTYMNYYPAIANWPSNVYGILQSYVSTSSSGLTTLAFQMVIDYHSDAFVRRMENSGTWSEWNKLEKEYSIIKKVKNAYIGLSGTTADISNPTAETTYGYCYSVVDCSPGDIFIINATGGTAPRAYGFIDENSKIIDRANASVTLTNKIIVAPYGASKLIINDRGGTLSYIGTKAKTQIRVYDEKYKKLFKIFQRVGVIGDSLSVGYMWDLDTSTAISRMLQYSWVKQIGREAGVPWLNIGTSGQNVLTWCTNEDYGKVQLEASGNKCQAYIIGLGENDASDSVRHVDLGTTSDIVDDYSAVATTFYGGYNRIIQLIKHLNPTAKIFCLTNANKNTTGRPREDYSAAVRYIAQTHYTTADNVYLIDMEADYDTFFFPNSPIRKDGAEITSHFSAVGYEMIAEYMMRKISQTILDHQTDFVNVAYIPHDTGNPTADTMTE